MRMWSLRGIAVIAVEGRAHAARGTKRALRRCRFVMDDDRGYSAVVMCRSCWSLRLGVVRMDVS